MQIGKIEFGLPEHRNEFYIASHSVDIMIAIREFFEKTRQLIKYDEELSEDYKDGVRSAVGILIDELEDNGINLDWLE